MDSFISELEKLGVSLNAGAESSVSSSHNRAVAKNGAVPGGQILTQGAVPTAIDKGDAATHLDQVALSSNYGKDWRNSPHDLFVLLGADTGGVPLNEVAAKLGCPSELLEDENGYKAWLHAEIVGRL